LCKKKKKKKKKKKGKRNGQYISLSFFFFLSFTICYQMSVLRPAFTVLRRSYAPSLTRRLVQIRLVSFTTSASASEVKVEPQQQQQQQQQQKTIEQDPRLPMLRATMLFIPEYGWSMESLIHGAKSLGYPSVAHGMFPGGEAGLIDAHLADTRKTFVKLVKEKLPELEGYFIYAMVFFYYI
jgi:hypothetical protein